MQGLAGYRASQAIDLTNERLAVYLDLENLVWEHWQNQSWEEATLIVSAAISIAKARGTVVRKVAVCDRNLAEPMAFPLRRLGVQVHIHYGGLDAADQALASRLRTEVPASCTTVIIGSGDGGFAEVATELKTLGLRVEALSRANRISYALQQSVDTTHIIDMEVQKERRPCLVACSRNLASEVGKGERS